MAKLTYAAAPKQYAEQVVAGDIPACLWVKLACKRRLNDLINRMSGKMTAESVFEFPSESRFKEPDTFPALK